MIFFFVFSIQAPVFMYVDMEAPFSINFHCRTKTGCYKLQNFPELPFRNLVTGDDLDEHGHGFSTLVVGNQLYIAGGHGHEISIETYHPVPEKHFCRFDAETNEWCILPPMLERHCKPALVECDGYIYAIGKTDWGKSSDNVERFSIAIGEWQMVASVTEKVNKVMALACNRLISVSATGIDQDGNDIEIYMMYNPGRNIWTQANVIKPFPDFHCQWFGLYQNVWYCCRNTFVSEDAVDRVICDLESNTPTITIGPHVDDLTIQL